MKYLHIYTLLLMVTFQTSYAQSQTNTAINTIPSGTKDTVSAYDPNRMVRNVKQGSNGNILIASSLSGVFKYDGKSFTNLTNKIGVLRYWDVLEDRRGNIWISTTDSGVYKYDGSSFQHFTTRDGLANNAVIFIYEDRVGNIWFGTGGGASHYDGKSFLNFTTKEGLPDNRIHTILEDKTGRLWFGTNSEACYYDGKTFTVFKNNDGKTFNNVWSIIEDRRGNIWFGASIIDEKKGSTLYVSSGLWRYDGSSFTKVIAKVASAIMEDKEGNIWTTGPVSPNGVGAWQLSRYDQKSLYHKKPAITTILSVNKMLCGILEANGSIWVGSINGVYRYDGKTVTDFKDTKAKN
ncbi:ligand-binding sensor domain-containing protein [Mucilaginibacter terrae]|uniref:Ligand-binding sensor domain-containing protein n=1 Tax=Mucilaginibacter terrae TaxID=1955052 RepID=A0ABU3GYV7_9SPHI|nr:two-component regulator propeller domain-containing protein [Mucilaginibacter terrae]MDT3404959.1 ligand-binding sensor domain-containing protein [Mucilaginibacter terrae]